MKKAIIVAIIIVAGVGFYIYNHQVKAPGSTAEYQDKNQPSQGANDSAALSQSGLTATSSAGNSAATGSVKINAGSSGAQSTFSSGENTDAGGSGIQVVEVDFDGSGFTPATVSIKAGDYVFFKNKSGVDFWPASDPHPTHTDYPGFDAGHPIAPGGEYKFQFNKVGSWGYHNHLQPSEHGIVKVSQ